MEKPRVGEYPGEAVYYLAKREAVEEFSDGIVAQYDLWLRNKLEDMHIISQAYCMDRNKDKELDSDLLMDIITIMKKHLEVV